MQQTEQVDYPNGLRVRGEEVIPGGTLNYRINAYVRVAHGADVSAGISLTSGGVWDKDTRTFTTLPTTDFAGATVLGKLPANFLNSQVYDYYVFNRLFVDGESGVTGDSWHPGGKADRDNDGTAPALTPGSVMSEHLAAGAVGLLKLAAAVIARIAPALAGNGGKVLAANADETALEFIDAAAGGGGENGRPDAKQVIYSSAVGITAAGALELSAAVALDNDWDELLATVDDKDEANNGKVELALAFMADVRQNWNPIAGLSGARTHAYAIGNRFLEFGGTGNVGIYGRLEGTAESITHFNVGFNSGGRLFELRVVRGKTGGDARLDATPNAFGGRLTGRLNLNENLDLGNLPLTDADPNKYNRNIDLSRAIALWAISNGLGRYTVLLAHRSDLTQPFTLAPTVVVEVTNNSFTLSIVVANTLDAVIAHNI